MKLLKVLAFSIMCVTPLQATELIEGAFGLKLGDTLNVDADRLTRVQGFDDTVYRIVPPKPLAGFDEYIIYVTPLSRKIYQIRAFRYHEYVGFAKEDAEVLYEILKQKYSNEKSKPRRRVGATGGVLFTPMGRNNLMITQSGNSVNVTYRTGKDVANVDRIEFNRVSPVVIITYRSKDYKLRKAEYKDLYRKTREHFKEAESVL